MWHATVTSNANAPGSGPTRTRLAGSAAPISFSTCDAITGTPGVTGNHDPTGHRRPGHAAETRHGRRSDDEPARMSPPDAVNFSPDPKPSSTRSGRLTRPGPIEHPRGRLLELAIPDPHLD